MIGFALCHGWSFDQRAMARVDEALACRFPHAARTNFDLGFTGRRRSPHLAPGVDWIAVGHSYGFASLMLLPTRWKAAVSLNGFTRFCPRPGRAMGTPAHVVDGLLERVREAPLETVAEFHRSCGASDRVPPELDRARLVEHLARLRDLDLDAPACPVLALATESDAIVSMALAEECFASPSAELHRLPGDHVSLTTKPEPWTHLVEALVARLDG